MEGNKEILPMDGRKPIQDNIFSSGNARHAKTDVSTTFITVKVPIWTSYANLGNNHVMLLLAGGDLASYRDGRVSPLLPDNG